METCRAGSHWRRECGKTQGRIGRPTGQLLFCLICMLSVPPLAAQTVRLSAVGDVMLAGGVAQLMQQKGSKFPFAKMRPLFLKSDIVFANLECCVSRRGEPLAKQFRFRADPVRLPALKAAGITLVSCANNHAWDYGREALLDTVHEARRAGLRTIGAGRNRQEAHRLEIVRCRGVRIGFLAYLGLTPALLPESESEPCLAMASVDAMRSEIKAARPQVDVLVVSLHAGQEGAALPTPKQRAFAQAAIDAGADLVIGHHPHVVQPLVRYHGKPICYSLGNFVFSRTGRGSGALLSATLGLHHRVRATCLPLSLQGGQPRLTGR